MKWVRHDFARHFNTITIFLHQSEEIVELVSTKKQLGVTI